MPSSFQREAGLYEWYEVEDRTGLLALLQPSSMWMGIVRRMPIHQYIAISIAIVVSQQVTEEMVMKP